MKKREGIILYKTDKRNETWKLFVALMFFSIILLNISPTTSYACSCVQPGAPLDELDNSSVVFSGKVIEIVDVNKSRVSQSSADPMAVLFEVKDVWKGINQSQVLVYTERDSASCGFEFAVNEEYIVYAKEANGDLRASLCSRTATFSEATMDLTDLGKGEKPTVKATAESDTSNFEDQLPIKNAFFINPMYIFLIFAGLVVIGLYIARGYKKRG